MAINDLYKWHISYMVDHISQRLDKIVFEQMTFVVFFRLISTVNRTCILLLTLHSKVECSKM